VEPRPLDPGLRRILDEALERVPLLRQRSLVDYVRRHYACKVPRRTAAAYLKELGLVERTTVKVKQPMRRFEAPTPLDLVQVDIVYVPKIGGGWLYSVNCLDDHSRMLLGATALEEQTGEAVLRAFRAIVARWGRPNRVLTDRGTQFVHWRGKTAFQKYVQNELKAEHIRAAAKHPQTLGKLERFHSSLRQEGLDPKGYADVNALQGALDRYLGYYNHERPHQGIGGVVPADRFYGMANPLEEVWRKLAGWGPDRAVFLTMNLLGRRFVLAGPSPDQLQVLWDDKLPVINPTHRPGKQS
jgi:transposase InsO family protein